MNPRINLLQSRGSPSSEVAGRKASNVVRLPRRRRSTRSLKLDASRQFDLWRHPTDSIDPARIEAIAACLNQVLAFGDSRWSAALKGDAAAAISLAVDAFVREQPATMPCRLAFSALWLCAARGDPAADLTLRFLKARLGVAL